MTKLKLGSKTRTVIIGGPSGSHAPDREDVEFVTEGVSRGYAHAAWWGTYKGPATREDVERQFYHPMFGGREARIEPYDTPDADGTAGKWFAIEHTD